METFTEEERRVLAPYFTNLDGPVFALVNLPEVVKGALFARYSRSSKSLRRLFLDEFVNELDISGDATIDATVGLRRAEELYDRVFFEYGDDSVAQLGGVHLACEQASNVLTKVLEWGRLMAYLEQSTRYIAYDARIGGRYRFHRDPDVLQSSLGTRYVGDMDRLFDTYAELLPSMQDFFREQFPKSPEDSDFVYRQAIRAKAFDSLRGILPAASLSNVGLYAGTWPPFAHVCPWPISCEMNPSAASSCSGVRSFFGSTNVCESASVCALPMMLGTGRMSNFSFWVWKVVTSHSPLSANAAVWLPNSATDAW